MILIAVSLLEFLKDIAIHPLTGTGYAFWSGIGSGSPLLAGIYMFWRKHNCHVKGCWRLQFKAHPGFEDHVVCRKHHPYG